MWILLREGDDSNNGFSLLSNREYVVGRKDCSIVIEKDPSISRKHAIIRVKHDEVNLADPAKTPELTLQDTSKYGVIVNGKKITEASVLKSGDKILFGTHNSNYKVIYNPMVVVTSCLDSNQKKKIKSLIQKLGGHVVNDWHLQPAITHLVMEDLTFTIKVIHALAACCPIVKPSYFEQLINKPDGKTADVAIEKYLPTLKEASINPAEVTFHPIQKRKTLFCDHVFVFLSKKQYKRLLVSVQMSGGRAVIEETSDSKEQDLTCGMKLTEDKTHVMMIDPKEHGALSTDAKQWIAGIIDLLRRNKKRPIPESEFGLALLHCSMEKYCNSRIDAVPELTQALVSQSFHMADMMSQAATSSQASQLVSQQFKMPPVPTKSKQCSDEQGKKRTRQENQSHSRLGSESSSDEEMMSKRRKVCDGSKLVVPESQNTSAVGINDSYQARNVTEIEEGRLVKPVPETQSLSTSVVNRSDVHPVPETQTLDLIPGGSVNSEVPETQDMNRYSSTHRPDIETQKIDSVKVESCTRKPVPGTQSMNTSCSVAKDFVVVETQEMESSCSDSIHDESRSVVTDCNQLGSKNERDLPQSFSSKHTEGKTPVRSSSKVPMNDRGNDSLLSHVIKKEKVSPTGDGRGRNHQGWLGAKDSTKEPTVCINNEEAVGKGKKRQKIESVQTNGEVPVVKREPSEDPEIIPDGFLSSRIPRQKPADFSEDDSLEDIPTDLVVVEGVSLVVRQPGYRSVLMAPITNPKVKNFKKFQKQYYPGCEGTLPHIIGGTDLVVHQSSCGADLESWFTHAREVNAEQERAEREAEALFRWDGKQKSSKRSKK